MRQRKSALVWLVLLILLSFARPSLTAEPILRGIVCIQQTNLPPDQFAIIEVFEGPSIQQIILKEGERDGNVELLRILPKTGEVLVRERGSDQQELLRFPKLISGSNDTPTFQFHDVRLKTFLSILQIVSARTTIASESVSGAFVNVTTAAFKSRTEALDALEQALLTNDLILKRVSDKFLLMARSAEASLLKSIPDPPPGPPPTQTAPMTYGIFPVGLLSFTDTDLAQVLDIYQDLTGRTVIHANALAKVSLRSQTPLSRQEATWLLDSAIRLRGVAMIPESKFVFAIPASQTNGLPRFDREKLLAKAVKTTLWEHAPINLNDANSQVLLKSYAAALGRQPLLLSGDPNVRLHLRSQTPLDQAETIYALEALAWANHLAFEPVPPDKVRLIPLP